MDKSTFGFSLQPPTEPFRHKGYQGNLTPSPFHFRCKRDLSMRAAFLVFTLFACANAFQHTMKANRAAFKSSRISALRMSEEPSEIVPLVPVDKVNVENAGAVTGAFLGLVLGGPVLAALLAAITNYVIKQEGESGEALRGVGKTVVESVNFLTKLNTKYSLTDKAGDAVGKALSNIETESEALQKVKSTYTTVVSKVSELNEEYDLVSKGKEVLASTAALSDAAIEKLVELNNKVIVFHVILRETITL